MKAPPRRLTRAAARRVAITAQGLGRARPPMVDTRALLRVLDTVDVVQIDSVNALVRSHYLPFFSRLGPYDRAQLDALRDRAPRRLVEYWVHEASLVSPRLLPHLRFRMADASTRAWGGMRTLAAEQPQLIERIHAEVLASARPLLAREVEEALARTDSRERPGWGWNWSEVKTGLEYLFWSGAITSAGRTKSFERRYADPQRVLPPGMRPSDWPEAPAPAEEFRHLIRRAATCLGVASAAALRDYHRLSAAQAGPAIEALVARGELVPTAVAGVSVPMFSPARLRTPRSVEARALLSPFDSLVWTRDRLRQLWDFDFRLELYVPRERRVHGYYVLPFLLGEDLIGRVDLRRDSATGRLAVGAVHWEASRGGAEDRGNLDAELHDLDRWLGGTRAPGLG